MKKRNLRAVSGIAATALAAAAFVPTQANAASVNPSPPSADPGAASASRPDNLPNPLAEAQNTLREESIAKLMKGEAKTTTINGNRVIEVAGKTFRDPRTGKSITQESRYVNYPVNREEAVFTILVEFGDQKTAAAGGTNGPLHNQIVAPDKTYDGSATDDNTTLWRADFNRQHYLDMMFGPLESFKNFYLKQSNGRFLTKGDVSNWVKVPYNEARYGHNPVPGDGTSQAGGYWNFVKDSAAAWYQAQKDAGQTDAQIQTYLAQFDKVDRYDYDGDGVFNEPDGYVDHIQVIHAGEGEEAGGGAQGADAIWSHRWYAYSTNMGVTGPDFNKLGGVPIGNSGIWVGDYTTEPENGGLGVFTHEFGHDLGLPDLYDTAGGDNGTGFWTLMSSGSWLSHSGTEIGSSPGYMAAWEKLQLGWLDYKVVQYGVDQAVRLGPADRDGAATPQAIAVALPNKAKVTALATPHSGSYQWWGGSADNLNSTLTRTIDLTGTTGSASVAAWVSNDIEEGYDYLYGEVSTDGGQTWTQIGEPISGTADWRQLTWDLSAYSGQTVQFRFRYQTDPGYHLGGPFIDDISVNDGVSTFNDDVESGSNGWTAAGFTRVGASITEMVPHFYLAENRVYAGYDRNLKTGPYNFGFLNTKPDWVEHFRYQNGLLITYSDGAVDDNNTSEHPGQGQSLPVDSHPGVILYPNGKRAASRIQTFDSTFGLERTDPLTLHRDGVAFSVPQQRAVPVFNDTDPNRYWSSANPMGSTKVAGSGTVIRVLNVKGDEMTVQVTFN